MPVAGTAPGEIGSSRYRPDAGIFLVGAANQDTDEYDRHVIAHEFGHYLEHSFSRSDSFGGPHALTDQLDIRVAFGEAWGSAFAAMVTGAGGLRRHAQRRARRERSASISSRARAAMQSESRLVQRGIAAVAVVRSLRQRPRRAAAATFAVDDLALGFAPIWAAFTTEQRTTRALTSVFPFVNALKVARPADQSHDRQLDDVAAHRGRSRDDYGTGQTNFGLPTQRTPARGRGGFPLRSTTR